MKAAQAAVPDTIFIQPDNQAPKPDATEQRRQEIVAYVKERLGEDLAGVFADAIPSSVSSGCYDHGWAAGDFRRIDAYVDILQQDWLRKQGDVTHLLVRLQHLLAFGSDEQKVQLKTLLSLP